MWREFRLKKGSKVLLWKIRQDGETYYTTHGQMDGKMQEFNTTPGPKGKEDTKAYVNAVDNCAFNVEREIRFKEEHGYIEYIDGKPSSVQVNSIDFNKMLPKNFTSYKPQTSIDPDKLEKLFKAKKTFFTRKYDGMAHVACKHPWGWEVYTRRMDLTTDRLPVHIEELNKLSFDVGTVLVGELVCLDSSGKNDFKNISRFCRSDPPVARELISNKEVQEPNFLIFDILFYNGTALNNKKYNERRKLCVDNLPSDGLIYPVKQYDVTPLTWEKIAKDNGWEGFVVTDLDGVPGEKFFSFDGDAKRPQGSWKCKPTYSEEVVVYAGTYGSGKRQDTVGAVLVKQKHPDTNEWFRCGKVGSGFTEEDLDIMEGLLKFGNYPIYEKDKDDKNDLDDQGIVIEIEYSERQPGTNKFRFPVYMRVRTDKRVNECYAQKLAPEEE